MRRMGIGFLGLVFALCFGGFAAHAQVGGSLSYGSAQIGTISAASPLIFFSFPASAGDIITVNVIGLTPGFDPSVSLLNPSQQPVAASDNDPTAPGALDAHLAQRLDMLGNYALLIGGVNGTTGDFLVKLNGLSTGQPPTLTAGSAAVADFATSVQPQFITIPADPSAPLTLSLAAQPASFSFAAQVFGLDGALIAEFDGAPQANVSLPAGAGNALVILQPSSPEATGAVQISTGSAPVSGGASGPVTPPQNNVPPPAGDCTVGSAGTVNLRSGAGTGFPVVGSLNPGNFLAVQGVSPDRGWYAVNLNGQQAWVSATVASLNGPCGNLPTVQPPAGQVQPTTGAPPTVGVVVTETIEPTADLVAPTQPPSAAPPVPTAPPDNDYQVQLDRNNGGSFSQQISYPDGDRSDRIAVSVSNFDSINTFAQFSVALVCSGTGSEFVRWGENQSQNLACGQNLTLVFTNESNQRFLNVTLPNGSGPALVNYTLVFVKTG